MDLLDGAIDYEYDALGQLVKEHKASGNNQYQQSFEYDPAGNRSRMVKGNLEHLYTYNNANQLTRENISGPAVLPITVTGTVSDATGISSLTINGTSATLEGENFTCPVTLSSGANTLTVSATDLVGNTATKTLTVTYDNQAEQVLYLYDNNGNLIRKQSAAQTLNLGYDYEDRLISAASGMNIINYTYDALGRRITKDDGAGTIINYVYDEEQIIAEYAGVFILTKEFIYGPGIDEPMKGLSVAGSIPEWYYHFDGIGSVSGLTDANGSLIEQYDYNAFGKTTIKDASNNVLTQSTVGNRYGFTGRELDTETGLYYYRARHYSPGIGRFLQTDPLGIVDENAYVCDNDPVNFTDPYGLQAMFFAPLGGAALGYAGLSNFPGVGAGILPGANAIPGQFNKVKVRITGDTAQGMGEILTNSIQKAAKEKGKKGNGKKEEKEKEKRKKTIKEHWDYYRHPRDPFEKEYKRKEIRGRIIEYRKRFGRD